MGTRGEVMARNEWINGYLEAILDVGNQYRKIGDVNKAAKAAVEAIDHVDDKGKKETSLFSTTRYFVEEAVNSFDERDLHRTWIKVIATRNTLERNNRLENTCWRIWHLARKKKRV